MVVLIILGETREYIVLADADVEAQQRAIDAYRGARSPLVETGRFSRPSRQ